VRLLPAGRRGKGGEAAAASAGRPRWLVPLSFAFAGAVIAPRIGPVRRALDTVVRCSSGHLFTTLWFPLGSFKAIRFGGARFQRCPVGRHWAVVRRAEQSELSPEELREAHEHHDLLII
jgi:hypothetical protein